MTDKSPAADQPKPSYRMVRRGRGQNTHLVPIKHRKGRGRRCLKTL